MLLLDTFVALTGYVRKYAMWLLNHPVESRPSIQHTRPVHYGPEVQDALYQAWRAALPDAISHYKSAPCSEGCARSGPICWKSGRSSGRKK